MQCSKIAATAVLLFVCTGPVSQAGQECQWRPLFDGKTLAGWHKVGHGEWEVKDGAIVGTADNAKLYGLLESNDVFKDFTVRFKFRCFSGDSGFYVRTMILPPEKAHKMQIQVGRDGSGTGGVYESYGRGWLDKLPKEEESKLYRPEGEWNEMVIDAHGQKIVVTVNGTKTAEVEDAPDYRAGHCVLQMHAGCVMHVEFKDIEVCDDNPQPQLKPVKPAADGSIALTAAAGRGMGPRIKLMPEWKAFGSGPIRRRSGGVAGRSSQGGVTTYSPWNGRGDQSAGNPTPSTYPGKDLSAAIGSSGSGDMQEGQDRADDRLERAMQFAALEATAEVRLRCCGLREVRLVPAAR